MAISYLKNIYMSDLPNADHHPHPSLSRPVGVNSPRSHLLPTWLKLWVQRRGNLHLAGVAKSSRRQDTPVTWLSRTRLWASHMGLSSGQTRPLQPPPLKDRTSAVTSSCKQHRNNYTIWTHIKAQNVPGPVIMCR